MDIKERIEKVVDRIKSDDQLLAKFKQEPTKTVESVLDVDLPDEVLDKVVAGVKAKLATANLGDKLGGAADGLKGIFGK